MEHAIQLQSEATRALCALKEDPLCMYIYSVMCRLYNHCTCIIIIHICIDTFADGDIERWVEEVKERLSNDFGNTYTTCVMLYQFSCIHSTSRSTYNMARELCLSS